MTKLTAPCQLQYCFWKLAHALYAEKIEPFKEMVLCCLSTIIPRVYPSQNWKTTRALFWVKVFENKTANLIVSDVRKRIKQCRMITGTYICKVSSVNQQSSQPAIVEASMTKIAT